MPHVTIIATFSIRLFKKNGNNQMNIEAIHNEALSLPLRERAHLAEQLLSSLDALSKAEIEQLWFQEAALRASELDQGLVQRISSDVVLREAHALLK